METLSGQWAFSVCICDVCLHYLVWDVMECSFGLLIDYVVGLWILPCAGIGSIKLWLCLVALQGPGASTCTFPLGVSRSIVP